MYLELRKMANFYFYRIASIAAFAMIVLIFYIAMLLNNIRKTCCSSKNRKPKKRAGNRMVIGEEELGEIEDQIPPVDLVPQASPESDEEEEVDKELAEKEKIRF